MFLNGGFNMIDIKDKLLESLIYKAKKIATKKSKKQLLSMTEKIDPIHLFSFFDNSKQFQKNRIFWSDIENDFYLIGLGQVKQIIAEKNRYDELQRKWQSFINEALVHQENNEFGTGLIALGGMTFDPLKQKTKQWKDFPTSELIVPEFMITKQKTDYYFTVNLFINEDENIEKLTTYLENKKDELLNYPLVMNDHSHNIYKKEEIKSDEWIQSVIKARDEVRSDRIQKIVMAREMKVYLDNDVNITSIINNLINAQPNSYVFAFEKGDNCFIGGSPERLVRVNEDHVLSTCLAGTAPRGISTEEDEKIKEALFHDHKNREEHDYVVQMIRHSIHSHCEQLNIPNEPVVLSLKDLHHLYTPVKALLKEGSTIFDFIEQLHPTPALGGEPKEQSLAFIRQYEQLDRGWYGAPVGWIDYKNNGEFAVAIRSGLIEEQEVSLFAGCGVMKDSDPQLEYEETGVKFLPVLNALEDE